MPDENKAYAGYVRRSDGTYVPEGEMKTAVIEDDLGCPEVIVCGGKRYFPFPEDSAMATITSFVASLKEDEVYAAEKMAQAQPVYYAIRDKKRVVSAPGYGDDVIFVFGENGPEGDFSIQEAVEVYLGLDPDGLGADWYEDEIAAHLKNAVAYGIADESAKLVDGISDGQLRQFLTEYVPGEILYVSEEWYICPNTLFLTHGDAQAHLDANHHHYTSKAYVYCMTAWRSPEYEKFIGALKEAF